MDRPFLISQCYNLVQHLQPRALVVAPFLISQCYNARYSLRVLPFVVAPLYIALHQGRIFLILVKPLNKVSEGALIMLIFYTVNPEPVSFPKAYILKVFKDINDKSQCIKTVCFPIRNPTLKQKTENEAYEYGRLFVKELMDKECNRESLGR